MSELLTREEYAAVAAGFTLPRTAFIDGSFRKAKSKKTFPTVNPATGGTLAEFAACGADDATSRSKRRVRRSRTAAGPGCIRRSASGRLSVRA